MSDAEFFAKVNPQRLTSLDEDFKKEQAQFLKDELDRALRRSGKVKPEPQETTYERFPEEA
jgi:hypothetical protein